MTHDILILTLHIYFVCHTSTVNLCIKNFSASGSCSGWFGTGSSQQPLQCHSIFITANKPLPQATVADKQRALQNTARTLSKKLNEGRCKAGSRAADRRGCPLAAYGRSMCRALFLLPIRGPRDHGLQPEARNHRDRFSVHIRPRGSSCHNHENVCELEHQCSTYCACPPDFENYFLTEL